MGETHRSAKVEPVTAGAVVYSAPNTDGRKAVVQAHSAEGHRLLWEVVVFENTIDPQMEKDVQWVYIKSLRIQGVTLRVTDEKDRLWSVDLQTRRVKQEKISDGGGPGRNG